jgi:hypothetical protein
MILYLVEVVVDTQEPVFRCLVPPGGIRRVFGWFGTGAMMSCGWVPLVKIGPKVGSEVDNSGPKVVKNPL